MNTARLVQLKAENLDVTSGKIVENSPYFLAVDDPSMRATVRDSTNTLACLQFRYLEPTKDRVKTKGGIEFHQIGLKLLSRDPCNLLYVMWRIHPNAELVILQKSNPGQTESNQCCNHGYTDLFRKKVLPFAAAENHELLAQVSQVDGQSVEVTIWTDFQEAARVTLNPKIFPKIDGVSGIRSENGRYQFRYSVGFPDKT
jgi:hypothetical protein